MCRADLSAEPAGKYPYGISQGPGAAPTCGSVPQPPLLMELP